MLAPRAARRDKDKRKFACFLPAFWNQLGGQTRLFSLQQTYSAAFFALATMAGGTA